MDRRINRAAELCALSGQRRYVYVEGDHILIAFQRPRGKRCVIVSPERWAIVIEKEAEEP